MLKTHTMRGIIIIILILVLNSTYSYAQTKNPLLDREEDIMMEEFSIENFMNFDTEFALGLLERQARTLIKSTVAETAAAVPYVGTTGVAMELGLANLKLDEILVADKNYNYKVTGVLGNILKITKESRDGTIKRRILNNVKKAKIIKQTINAIKKCNRTREAVAALGTRGWTTSTMLRAVKSIDVTLDALETVGETLTAAYNSLKEENEAIDKAITKLDEVELLMDEIYSDVMKSVYDNIISQYKMEYNSSLLTGAIYFQEVNSSEAEEDVAENMEENKNTLIAFKRIMWIFTLLYFFAAAAANVWKVYFNGEENHNIIRYNKSWLVGLAILLLLNGIFERVVPIIISI